MMTVPGTYVEGDPTSEFKAHPNVEILAYMEGGAPMLRLTWRIGPSSHELVIPADVTGTPTNNGFTRGFTR